MSRSGSVRAAGRRRRHRDRGLSLLNQRRAEAEHPLVEAVESPLGWLVADEAGAHDARDGDADAHRRALLLHTGGNGAGSRRQARSRDLAGGAVRGLGRPVTRTVPRVRRCPTRPTAAATAGDVPGFRGAPCGTRPVHFEPSSYPKRLNAVELSIIMNDLPGPECDTST
jgi:hypothetical protein